MSFKITVSLALVACSSVFMVTPAVAQIKLGDLPPQFGKHYKTDRHDYHQMNLQGPVQSVSVSIVDGSKTQPISTTSFDKKHQVTADAEFSYNSLPSYLAFFSSGTAPNETKEVAYKYGLQTKNDTVVHDTEGREVERSSYSPDDELKYRSTSIYENGRLVRREFRDQDGGLKKTLLQRYNKNGWIVSRTITGADGQVQSEATCTYSADGTTVDVDNHALPDRCHHYKAVAIPNGIEEHSYDADKKYRGKTVYRWDAHGNVVELSCYNQDGKLSEANYMKYNERDEIVGRTTKDIDVSAVVINPSSGSPTKAPRKGATKTYPTRTSAYSVSYTYDSHKNWTEKRETEIKRNGKPIKKLPVVIIRDITYYE